MSGGYQIDIVAPQILQPQHGIAQIFDGTIRSRSLVAYLMVLTVAALEAAMREKDRARSLIAGKGRLLSEVRAHGGYHNPIGGAAQAAFAIQPIRTACPGAQGTGRKGVVCLLDASGKVARSPKAPISWLEIAHAKRGGLKKLRVAGYGFRVG
jgi:hypothetical protein